MFNKLAPFIMVLAVMAPAIYHFATKVHTIGQLLLLVLGSAAVMLFLVGFATAGDDQD